MDIPQQAPLASEPDIDQAAIEVWRQTRNDSVDWEWARVNATRKAAYRRMAVAILSAAGCINGLGG
jgi:hypothetical protein